MDFIDSNLYRDI